MQVEEKKVGLGSGGVAKEEVLCGNMKMMRRYNVFPRLQTQDDTCKHSELIKNIHLLEQ